MHGGVQHHSAPTASTAVPYYQATRNHIHHVDRPGRPPFVTGGNRASTTSTACTGMMPRCEVPMLIKSKREQMWPRVVCAANCVMRNPHVSTADALDLIHHHRAFATRSALKATTPDTAVASDFYSLDNGDIHHVDDTTPKISDILRQKHGETWSYEGGGGHGRLRHGPLDQRGLQQDACARVAVVSPDDTVLVAVQKMAAMERGSLMVMIPPQENDVEGPPSQDSEEVLNQSDLVGIVTERDYLLKVVVAGRTSATTKVYEIMTGKSQLLVLSPSDSVMHAMTLMADKNIRHLPVVQHNHLLGVVSIRDVVSAIVRSQRQDMQSMREFILGGPAYSGPNLPIA